MADMVASKERNQKRPLGLSEVSEAVLSGDSVCPKL
jgi:hypothetical protein